MTVRIMRFTKLLLGLGLAACASQEKEKILNTWETLQGKTDEKVD